MPKTNGVKESISLRRHSRNVNENYNIFHCTETSITWYSDICVTFHEGCLCVSS